jgi:DNA repair exonuclease SbcCD ATPase subunit
MQNEVEAKRKMESFETFEERIQKSEYLLDEMRKNTKEKEKKLESSSLQVKKNKKYITELEHRLVENNEQIESLSRKLKLQNDENIELETLLRKKNIEIQELRRRIQELEDELEEKTKEFFYEPDPKDKLDEMFAHYINKNRCPVSITKIGEGQYIFGTRKIFAKIQNERLVVRVGGGFMMIDEFLSAYTAQEIAKLKREEKHSYNVTSSQSSNLNTGNVTPKDRSYRAPFQNSYSKNASMICF